MCKGGVHIREDCAREDQNRDAKVRGTVDGVEVEVNNL